MTLSNLAERAYTEFYEGDVPPEMEAEMREALSQETATLLDVDRLQVQVEELVEADNNTKEYLGDLDVRVDLLRSHTLSALDAAETAVIEAREASEKVDEALHVPAWVVYVMAGLAALYAVWEVVKLVTGL